MGAEKYDLSTGKYYCNFLTDITTTGTFCPAGRASINRFFPALGDHDYQDAGMTNNLPSAYTDYFNLPGAGYTSSSNNERYYDFVSGPVHFFVLNSLDQPGWEPDETGSFSIQAQWLQAQLGISTSVWNVVVVPSPPYSSGTKHGSTLRMQWPFAQWGADVVFSGDEHNYERILRDGIVYFVNGLGGQWPYPFGPPVEGSVFGYNASNGAQRVIVTDTSMTFEFYSMENGGTLQDTYTITVPHNTATPTLPPNSIGWQSPTRQAAGTSNAGDNNGYESTQPMPSPMTAWLPGIWIAGRALRRAVSTRVKISTGSITTIFPYRSERSSRVSRCAWMPMLIRRQAHRRSARHSPGIMARHGQPGRILRH